MKKRIYKHSKTYKAEKKTSRKQLEQAAAIILLGSSLFAAPSCMAGNYELSFINIEKKPQESVSNRLFIESVNELVKQGNYGLMNTNPLNSEVLEKCFDTLLLDFNALEQNSVMTDCGYCQCISCICPNSCYCPPMNTCSCSCTCPCSCSSCRK